MIITGAPFDYASELNDDPAKGLQFRNLAGVSGYDGLADDRFERDRSGLAVECRHMSQFVDTEVEVVPLDFLRPRHPRWNELVDGAEVEVGACVELLYNRAWWVGHVFSIQRDGSFYVYFFDPEPELQHASLPGRDLWRRQQSLTATMDCNRYSAVLEENGELLVARAGMEYDAESGLWRPADRAEREGPPRPPPPGLRRPSPLLRPSPRPAPRVPRPAPRAPRPRAPAPRAPQRSTSRWTGRASRSCRPS